MRKSKSELILAALLLTASLWVMLALVVLSGCAHRPKVGVCDAPAQEHEGYTLFDCIYNPEEPSRVCCVYANKTSRCLIAVCTEDCNTWVVQDKECNN